jgi:hypothetical protein
VPVTGGGRAWAGVLACLTLAPRAAHAQAAAACPHGAADDKATLVSAAVTAPPAAIGPAVDSTLGRLGYAADTAESRPGQWVTLPRFTWPPGMADETWHGAENPGVQIVVDLEPHGDTTLVRVAASAVCALEAAAGTRPGGVENRLETKSAVQVATELVQSLQLVPQPLPKPTHATSP